MSFDWPRYLTLAQELVELSKKHANKEAFLRSAISRAYYAAFCKSRNYLRDIDKDKDLDRSPNVHEFVVDRFQNSNNKTKQKIGSYLHRLRRVRNVADYQDSFRNLEMITLQSLQFSEEVIEYFRKLRF
jgi:uncharacterized protein (UPF0332 family)